MRIRNLLMDLSKRSLVIAIFDSSAHDKFADVVRKDHLKLRRNRVDPEPPIRRSFYSFID